MEDIRFNGDLDLTIKKIGFVSVTRNENFIFEYKNGKDLYSFVYIEKGELNYYFYDTKKRITAQKGTLFFIPKQMPYRAKYLKNGTKIKIIIFDFCGNSIPFETDKPFSKFSPKFSGIFSLFSNYNTNNIYFLHSKIYELFYYIQNENLEIIKKYKKIIPAINTIESNFSENKKIQYYADMCSMSESNFRKLFKEYKGVSPIEYRNIIRCKEVIKLLDSGEFSVSEAAYSAGFHNMSFFYQVYNQYKKM